MSTVTSNKDKQNEITVVKKMRDYSTAPHFKEKGKKATEFLQKHRLPANFVKKEK